jgi:hypothetical protein
MFVATQLGQIELLSYALNNQTPSDMLLHLYSNNWSPNYTDTLTNYTEVSVSGYVPMVLNGGMWTIGLNDSGIVAATYPMQTFPFSTSVTAFGYYITDNAITTVIFAEMFSNPPFYLSSSGGNIKITPTVTFNYC